jgi:hypothetical protein
MFTKLQHRYIYIHIYIYIYVYIYIYIYLFLRQVQTSYSLEGNTRSYVVEHPEIPQFVVVRNEILVKFEVCG